MDSKTKRLRDAAEEMLRDCGEDCLGNYPASCKLVRAALSDFDAQPAPEREQHHG